ncbi:hypothetical protein H2198_006760 [Neophaeococcomyces mojaviensis]|uniref:Uncharacterized protein n=1 Tax=Neophaeococcomyces mojaviensis TaxID=3383035 RepID=A0ACC3A218_9EURO|nr:hypothetical protein H2198_006760 [Knufia sp. JES_112]
MATTNSEQSATNSNWLNILCHRAVHAVGMQLRNPELAKRTDFYAMLLENVHIHPQYQKKINPWDISTVSAYPGPLLLQLPKNLAQTMLADDYTAFWGPEVNKQFERLTIEAQTFYAVVAASKYRKTEERWAIELERWLQPKAVACIRDPVKFANPLCFWLLNDNEFIGSRFEVRLRIEDEVLSRAIAAAEKFPDCNIVGLDLDSTQQPRAVPQNLECEVFDVDSHWTFRHQSGFIFGRLFLSYYPPEKWAAFLLQAYHQLEPGGRIEFQEICEKLLSDDNTIPVAYKEWQQQWATACARGGFGTMTEDPEIIRQELYNAGFVDIEIKPYKIPVGTWAKDRKKKVIGSDALRFFEQGFISLGVKPFFKAGWSREDFNALVNRCLSQFKQTKGVHGYMTVFIFTARKPG